MKELYERIYSFGIKWVTRLFMTAVLAVLTLAMWNIGFIAYYTLSDFILFLPEFDFPDIYFRGSSTPSTIEVFNYWTLLMLMSMFNLFDKWEGTADLWNGTSL